MLPSYSRFTFIQSCYQKSGLFQRNEHSLVRRGAKHYSQQADFAGFDGGASRDQPEALHGSEGEWSCCAYHLMVKISPIEQSNSALHLTDGMILSSTSHGECPPFCRHPGHWTPQVITKLLPYTQVVLNSSMIILCA